VLAAVSRLCWSRARARERRAGPQLDALRRAGDLIGEDLLGARRIEIAHPRGQRAVWSTALVRT
jgi:hypothetical protein